MYVDFLSLTLLSFFSLSLLQLTDQLHDENGKLQKNTVLSTQHPKGFHISHNHYAETKQGTCSSY